MNKEQKVLNKLDEIISLLKQEKVQPKIIKLELEDYNFRVNSDGWHKITKDGKEYLENETKDVWELLDGECRGEQLFTYYSAIRETKKAGKLIPSDEQFVELKEKKYLKNVVFPGHRDTDGSFYNRGSYLTLWSSTPSGSNAWSRYLFTPYSTVYRNAYNKANGFSVRSIKI